MAAADQGIDIPPRLPLVAEPENRGSSTSKDARLVNCYAEKTKSGDWWIYKRPGLLKDSTNSQTTMAGMGVYNWKGDIYTAAGTHLYKNGVSIGTIDATNGVYRFSSSQGGTDYLVLGNGVKAYTVNGGFAQITDADFPAAFVKGWAYLDKTTYVMTANAAIQGSDLGDPTSWDALNTITAQIEPDAGVALSKQLVYVIVFKGWTTEVFYDAASPVGSPLGTVQGAKIAYGCASADSVQQIDDTLLWISTTREASPQVVMLSGLKADVVSSAAVERLLAAWDYTTIFSFSLKLGGHSFYVITSKVSNMTLAYDLKERMWSQWTDANGNYFPIVSSTFNSSMQHLLQHETNGFVYLASADYVNDDGATVTVDLYPPQFDGGVDRRKYLPFMRILADRQAGSRLSLRVNDYDYDPTKWSNWRSFDLSQRRPILTDCGSFDRRAFHFRHQSNTTMRLKAVDLQIALGALGGP